MASAPSTQFVRRIMTEAKHILTTQLKEKLEVEEDCTLTFDGATHNSVQYLGSQLRFQDGQRFILGH